MATYTGQITVPNSETWAMGGIYYYLQQASIGSGSIIANTTLDAYLAELSIPIGFTYVLTVGYTSTVIDISFIDYIDNGSGIPVSLGITPDSGGTYFTAFTESNGNTNRTTTCPTCLELTKSACQTSYAFVAGLTASTDYWVVIDNNRNKRYVQQVTTDGSGDFVIDATAPEFPEGFFIPEQFTYTLKVYTTSDLTTEADITYNNTVYNCITLSFIYTVTTTGSIGAGVDLWVDDNLNFVIDDTFNTISVG